ncbi:flavin reductase family protein [Arthrobacter sp. UC242_113]|uniref:flavin reductase family protein n=1 Tax=Arthrobacter sp. UC242_113 TaxID=3374550 RepID=UPI00375705A6
MNAFAAMLPAWAEVMRKDFDPGELSSRDFYRLLTAVVVPRPIAWISSRSAEGVDNLAPHSFFTVASADPPIVQFTSVGEKDSLRNIRSRGEFVVNLAPAGLIAEVNATGTNFPPDVSEFDAAGPGVPAAQYVAGRGLRSGLRGGHPRRS